jgi:ESS family glutamate:Na+ symporter
MEMPKEHLLQGTDVLILSILVLFLGYFLTRKIRLLRTFSIPPAVTGGLLCSLVITLLYMAWGYKVSFDMHLRDLLLLIFFSTVGLSAKLRVLLSGGKALVILLILASIFLIVQDVTGVLLVKLMGYHPGYGLFGGSISFAGGYGTAIAWGEEAAKAGFENAMPVGMACATFGLIAGGVFGGPVAERLIKRGRLGAGPVSDTPDPATAESKADNAILSMDIVATILVLAICVQVGDLVNRLLFAKGVLLPGFLTAMFTAIIITNGADLLGRRLSVPAVNLCSEVSLQIFLSMSLMSMQLWTLFQAMGPLLLILFVQVTCITLFTVLLVFRALGRDYDAAVISAGFVGLGLGATPVGIANMNAITSKYGPSPKAFLVIPLIGAFFIDIVNALVIKLFIALPIVSEGAVSAG